MVYNNKFIVAVKHRGKIMREVDDTVYLPFGSDYTLLLKNQNTVKAVADIRIDGMGVLDGNSIIVEPNSTVELEGFMDDSTVRNKFRFIEKTRKIYDYRGSRIDDGTIRVEYRFEKYKPVPNFYVPTNNHMYPSKLNSSKGCVYGASDLNDNGITVKGEQTRQDFVPGIVNTLEDSSSAITILLKGRKSKTNKIVKKPITVKTKIKCTTCGTKSKSSSKFCRECGAFLG